VSDMENQEGNGSHECRNSSGMNPCLSQGIDRPKRGSRV